MRAVLLTAPTMGGYQMFLCVVNNPDTRAADKYEIARVIYAETSGASLRSVEALASMIYNAARMRGCRPVEIVRDADMFESRCAGTTRNALFSAPPDNAGMQMCLRVVQKMLNENLPDGCCGATRFHHDTDIPAWAISRGYIADIDGMLFYL